MVIQLSQISGPFIPILQNNAGRGGGGGGVLLSVWEGLITYSWLLRIVYKYSVSVPTNKQEVLLLKVLTFNLQYRLEHCEHTLDAS